MYRKIRFVNAVASSLVRQRMDLNLSVNQEAAWSVFVSAVNKQKVEIISAMQARMQHASDVQAQQIAPVEISEHAQLMKQRVAGVETVAAAIKQLYSVLTSEQKKILDARIGREVPM